MKVSPILFNADMVRAILDGRKTQTRRPVKYIPELGEPTGWCGRQDVVVKFGGSVERFCPHGRPGDRLWVRETTRADVDLTLTDHAEMSLYAADNAPVLYSMSEDPEYNGSLAHWDYPRKTRPSIHMPRWASRITLEITGVRVELVQNISEDDAISDAGLESMIPEHIWYIPGTDSQTTRDPIYAFEHVWDACYGKTCHSWTANPWVWVIEFRRVA